MDYPKFIIWVPTLMLNSGEQQIYPTDKLLAL